jgi:hypothetical protein
MKVSDDLLFITWLILGNILNMLGNNCKLNCFKDYDTKDDFCHIVWKFHVMGTKFWDIWSLLMWRKEANFSYPWKAFGFASALLRVGRRPHSQRYSRFDPMIMTLSYKNRLKEGSVYSNKSAILKSPGKSPLAAIPLKSQAGVDHA